MTNTILEKKSRLQSLTQDYETLLGDVNSGEALSDDEQSVLDRISRKFDEIRSLLEKGEATAEQVGDQSAADGGGQNRKAGRLGKLKDMQSSIAGLMNALKSAR